MVPNVLIKLYAYLFAIMLKGNAPCIHITRYFLRNYMLLNYPLFTPYNSILMESNNIRFSLGYKHDSKLSCQKATSHSKPFNFYTPTFSKTVLLNNLPSFHQCQVPPYR